MSTIPKFIAFEQSEKLASWQKVWRFYEFDGDNTYLGTHDRNMGFPTQKVASTPRAFLYGETLEEIEKAVKLRKFQIRHGMGDGTDAKCPDCGYGYSFHPYADSDGLDESFSETITCICGCRFRAEIKVEISFEVKKL